MIKGQKRLLFQIRPPFIQIAKSLKDKKGWDIYGFHASKISEVSKTDYSGSLDLHSVIENSKAERVPENIVEMCRELEVKYKINLSDVISADRHLGISWMTGGLYHRGNLSYQPYEKHLQIVHNVFSEIKKYLDDVEPDAVCVDQVGSFVGALVYEICGALDVQIRSLVPVMRHSVMEYFKYYYWQRERTGAIPGLEQTYIKQKLITTGPLDIYEGLQIPDKVVTSEMLSRGSTSKLIRDVFRVMKNSLIRIIVRFKNRQFHQVRKALIHQTGHGEVPISSVIKYQFRKFFNFRKELRREYDTTVIKKESDYIYFPLHYEPEASLNGLEPHFTNQMYGVELLSKSVPVGVNVLVKEHPKGIGNRPAYWMDTISKFPNVKLVNPFEHSLGLIRGSLATVVITGSSGLEAALLGKPVISLGPNYRFNFVDHVWFANDIIGLRAIINHIYDSKGNPKFQEYANVLAKAIDETCFQLDDHIIPAKNPSQKGVSMAAEELARIVSDVDIR